MKKKKRHQDEENKEVKVIKFCVECQDDLENFSVTPTVEDLEAIKKNFENCRATGKYKGELCSKIFIASYEEPDSETKKDE